MKNFYGNRRSWRNGEKDVSDSSDGGNDHKNCLEDLNNGKTKVPRSKLKPSSRWQKLERVISSGSNQSNKISRKSTSCKSIKPSKLVSEVVDEVLNFKPTVPVETEENKIFHKILPNIKEDNSSNATEPLITTEANKITDKNIINDLDNNIQELSEKSA